MDWQIILSIRYVGIVLIILGTLMLAYKIQKYYQNKFISDEKKNKIKPSSKKTDQVLFFLAILYISIGIAYLWLSDI